MTYEQWVSKTEHSANGLINCAIASVLMDWTADRKLLLARIKEYEAFNEPLKRVYNENTAEEATP